MPKVEATMMPFAKLYLLLVLKAKRKGRTRDEVDQVTTWLTGYTPQELSWAGTVRHQLFFHIIQFTARPLTLALTKPPVGFPHGRHAFYLFKNIFSFFHDF